MAHKSVAVLFQSVILRCFRFSLRVSLSNSAVSVSQTTLSVGEVLPTSWRESGSPDYLEPGIYAACLRSVDKPRYKTHGVHR